MSVRNFMKEQKKALKTKQLVQRFMDQRQKQERRELERVGAGKIDVGQV